MLETVFAFAFGTLSGFGLGYVLLRYADLGSVFRRTAQNRQNNIWFLISDGTILEASAPAGAMFGACAGRPIRSVLADTLGTDLSHVFADLDELEAHGETMRACITDRNDCIFEIEGKPQGALIRLALTQLPAKAPLPGLKPQETLPLASKSTPKSEVFDTLLRSGASIVAWSRTNATNVHWAQGQITAGNAQRMDADHVVSAVIDHMGANPEILRQKPILRTQFEIQGKKEDGTHKPINLSVTEIDAGNGTRFGFAVDAEESPGAERTLARFVQTMTETFAHLTVGLAIFDRNRTLALFNPAMVRMWQVEPCWLARRPSLREILDELRANRRIPETADFHQWRANLLSLFDNTENADYEELWHLADGSNIRVLARPHPHGALAFVFDDVSERVRLEQQYRHSIDLRKSTLDHLNEGIAVFGANGQLQFANSAYHKLWETDEDSIGSSVHARSLLRLCADQTVESETWNRLLAFITSENNRRAWTARLTTGGGRVLSARFAPLPDGSTMTVFSDISDSERIALALRERNEALEMAEEMRVAVLNQISHKLRTPLNTIMGFSQLLTDPRFRPLEAEQFEYADGIVAAAYELLDNIDEVTKLTSLSIEPLNADDGAIGISEALHTIRELLEKRAAEADVSLCVQDDAGYDVICCDGAWIRQIIFNLAADAIQRSVKGGSVILGSRPGRDGGIEIYTVERPVKGQPNTRINVEINSLTLSLIRRMITREGGRVIVEQDDTDGAIHVTCHLDHTALARREDNEKIDSLLKIDH